MHWSSRTTFRGPPSRPVDPSCGGTIRSERIDDAQRDGTVVDPLPAAFQVGIDFVFAVLRPAAGPVEKMLGASSDRADPSELAQPAVAAAG